MCSLCMLFFTVAIAQKQNLYESIEYKKAYERGTRMRNGIPGNSYWQNKSDYKIEAKFDPKTRLITGHLKVTYFNNSPDSMSLVVFKLMQNVYMKGVKRQMPVEEINLHDGIQINNVVYNETLLEDRSVNKSGTIMRVMLPQHLGSKSSCSIELHFVTPLPKTSGFRSGSIDSTSFFAAYWFPQLAVYDDIFGWDTDEYVGVPENYNDFSSYEVALTFPSEYNVWATGKLANMDEIYSDDILKRIASSKKSSKPIMILSENDFRSADGKSHTWKYKAENVPDFAWAASDHYLWEGVAARNPDPQNLCWVQSAYPPGAKHFNLVVGIAQKSVELFSNAFPGVPYPYFKHISIRGTQGGGMEFPMIANNNVAHDTVSTITVTAHELAHNYFPFMMGINERKYGWWDETMTTLMESYVNLKGYPEHKVVGFFNRKVSFNYLSPTHDILPLITETSNIMKVMPTITNFYIKGPAAMDILVNIIGTNNFYAYTKEFIAIWAGKHPTPYDFFYFINEKEGKNLNWFWNAWFYSYGYPDVAITNAEQHDGYISIKMENVGGLPVQFRLTITKNDGSELDEEFNAETWRDNLEYTTVKIPVSGKVAKIVLDRRFAYDVDPSNNEFILEK